jgi:hypothetical protein
MYDFDGTTNSSTAKLFQSIETERMMHSMRPISMSGKPTRDPTFKVPHKDNNMPYFPPTASLERHNVNMYKKIPHTDFLPIYTRPYYSIYETGWTDMRHQDIFRN